MLIALLLSLPLWLLVLLTALLGLLVGSFLNVVIVRVPPLLQQQWQRDCRALLDLPSDNSPAAPDILQPASHCPACKTHLKPWHNIPLLSFLWLRGKCHACGVAISWRYPFIELLTALLSALVLWHFGPSLQALFALPLVWGLIALSMIDFDTQLLPDHISLPLLWLGLLINTQGVFVSATDAILGAALAYLFLWTVFHLFRLLTGKEGMGYGDFKLLAVLGAWFGWQMLPLILIVSTLLGIGVGLLLMAAGKTQFGRALPFGPYLCVAGGVALFAGHAINQWYLGLGLFLF
jgi:leader peptidase (prepilin peptidase)/N-methyltransferase